MCGDANNTEDIVDCVESKTFAPEDTVINAFRGFTVPTADLTEPRQEKDFYLTFTFQLFSPLLNFYLTAIFTTFQLQVLDLGRDERNAREVLHNPVRPETPY